MNAPQLDFKFTDENWIYSRTDSSGSDARHTPVFLYTSKRAHTHAGQVWENTDSEALKGLFDIFSST